ncbi:hypothetical protein C8R44DRAFT_263007 [Mycena epipterygia]|nr:hypothetical protein C8R44DRAFT_263007 [Mycena epipterygia]
MIDHLSCFSPIIALFSWTLHLPPFRFGNSCGEGDGFPQLEPPGTTWFLHFLRGDGSTTKKAPFPVTPRKSG